MAQIRTRPLRTLRSRSGLISFASIKTSQNGEDGIIAEIFRRIPRSSSTDKRWCVDVGAWDGKHLSNTWSLLVEDSDIWSGILIEADPKRTRDLKLLHEPLGNITVTKLISCLHNSPQSLSNVLKKYSRLPISFDFISIDVDGADYWLMDDLLQHYKPKVICIEFNPSIPDEVIYIQARDDNIRHGSSLAGIVELASKYNYTLIETCVFNAFFVPNDIYIQYFQDLVPDTSIEVLHDITMGTKLYQLYDGTLKLSGCKILLQHRIKIDEENLQIIPNEKRSFPFQPPSINDENNINDDMIVSIYKNSIDISCMVKKNIDKETKKEKNENANTIKEEQSKKLWETLARDGFAYVRGTGIDRQLCKNTLDLTCKYFEAGEQVRRSSLSNERSLRGYSPMNTENFASLLGVKAPNDCVRKFRIGKENNDTTKSITISNLHQSNTWPDSDIWPEYANQFHSNVSNYYNQLESIGKMILEMILDGMKVHGYSENANQIIGTSGLFNETKVTSCSTTTKSSSTTDILTLLGYKGKKKNARKKKKESRPLVAAHTDVGVITILLYEPNGNCAKLQRDKDGEWVDVLLPPLSDDPIFVINIGDCLSEMTNGTLRSTLHRVMPTGGHQERYCLAMFVGLNPEVIIQVTDKENGTITLTYEEWRKRRVKRAQAILNR
jgi:isopenicillin N synthase-like dioxygenase